MDRVCIGTCSGPAEAALVRAAFDAHGITVVINAEQHASMLGGLGGSFVPLRIYVAAPDAEDASALLRDLREGGSHEDPEDLAAEAEAGEGDAADDEAGAGAVEARVARRQRTSVVMLLAMCVTFGTASMYTGASLVGLALAAVELVALAYVATDPRIGVTLLAGCVLVDLIGSLVRLRSSGSPDLAPARALRRKAD